MFETGAVVTWSDWYKESIGIYHDNWRDIVAAKDNRTSVSWREWSDYHGTYDYRTHTYDNKYLQVIEPVKGPW